MNTLDTKIQYKTENEDDNLKIVAYAGNKKVGSLTVATQYVDDEESEYSYPFGAYVEEPFFEEITSHEYVINIEDLHIEKEYQKMGIASELMKRGMAEIKSRYSNVPVYINASPYGQGFNIGLDALIDFYKKFGFKVLKKYSQHRNALLWKDDTGSASSSLKIHRRILSALKLVLSENVLTLWHGGNLEFGLENVKHKGGRWEYGPGLYLTTHYDTARKYSKGSRKLYRIVIKKGNEISGVNIPISEVLSFVDDYVLKSKRKDIIERIEKWNKGGSIKADIFLNIMINEYAIKNTNTDELRVFLVKQGIDYSIVDNAFGWNERMVVLFNMKNIVSKTIIKPKDKIETYDLPTDFI